MRISDWSSDVCSSDLAGSTPAKARGWQKWFARERSTCRFSARNHIRWIGSTRFWPGSSSAMAGFPISQFVLSEGLSSRPTRDHSGGGRLAVAAHRSEAHTSELPSLIRISYDVFCLKQQTHDKP